MNPPCTDPAAAFAGWVPFHLARTTPEPSMLWTHLGDAPFPDPFFDQTLSTAFRHPLHLLLQRQTSLAQLVETAEHSPCLPPAGFIYHVSRCGSTLAAQMFARLPHLRVLSEPRPLTSALEDPRLSPGDRRRVCCALVRLYGRPGPGETAYLVKLDARNLLDWPLLLAAFPAVPRLLLHRDPLEVLVSNLQQLPASLVPGQIAPERLGPPAHPLDSPEAYAAFVLSRFYAAATALAAEPGTLTLDYRSLPTAVTTQVAAHFGLTLSPADLQAMATATAVYSKDAARHAAFTPDSAAKQDAADPALRQLCATWLQPHHHRLCQLAAA